MVILYFIKIVLEPREAYKQCEEYLERLEAEELLPVMEWPPIISNLNYIELLSEELEREVRKSATNAKMPRLCIYSKQ